MIFIEAIVQQVVWVYLECSLWKW